MFRFCTKYKHTQHPHTTTARMLSNNAAYDLSIAVVVIGSLAIAILFVMSFCSAPKNSPKVHFGHVLMTIGYSIMFGLAIWFMAAIGRADDGVCGPDAGSVTLTGNLSDYGFGPDKHLIVVNLTDIGGIKNVHDDDKHVATMQTWINGTQTKQYTIGVEIKGTLPHLGYKAGLSIETREPSDPEEDLETTFTEFGFTREFEDYVLRRETADEAFVKDGALFRAQPDYYEHTMVEVVYLVGETYTYEGVFYFVNNPVKKDTIPGAKKFKPETCDTSTYIIEWEYDANKPGNLSGFPNLELKYPKQSKLDKAPGCKSWLEQLLAFGNASQLDWRSLADGFVLQQSMLGIDMQHRSMVSHVLGGQLRSGPAWDAEERLIGINSARMSKWVVNDDGQHRTWWKTWLHQYPTKFEDGIRNSSMALTYNEAYQTTDALLRTHFASGYFEREQERYPCVKILKSLDQEQAWHQKRIAWVFSHVNSFTASKVTYIKTSNYDTERDLLIAGIVIFTIGVFVTLSLHCVNN